MLSPTSDKEEKFHSAEFPSIKLKNFQFPKRDQKEPAKGTAEGALTVATTGASLASPVSLPEGSESDLPNLDSQANCEHDNDNDNHSDCDLAPPPPAAAADQSSVSSAGSSSISSRFSTTDSLIFERFVQDPMIDSQPLPPTFLRHFSSENFVPPSLDTATGLITGDNDSDNATLQELELGLPQRRPSTANLEAALNNGRESASRRSSHSNLTRQMRASRTSLSSLGALAPQLTVSPEDRDQHVQSPSLKQNKSVSSFLSFAEMINQEDQELVFPIRRPSLSLSLSSQRMGRSSSMNSTSSFHGVNSPRSPAPGMSAARSPIFSPITARRNSNARFTNIFPAGARRMQCEDNDMDDAADPLSHTASNAHRKRAASRGAKPLSVSYSHSFSAHSPRSPRSHPVTATLNTTTTTTSSSVRSRADNLISAVSSKSSDEESLQEVAAS